MSVNIKNSVVEFIFNNGYKIVFKNSTEKSSYLNRRISCNKGDMKVFIKDRDVTKIFSDNGIIKYDGKKMTSDQIIKVCNIIKNLPTPHYENGEYFIGGKILRC